MTLLNGFYGRSSEQNLAKNSPRIRYLNKTSFSSFETSPDLFLNKFGQNWGTWFRTSKINESTLNTHKIRLFLGRIEDKLHLSSRGLKGNPSSDVHERHDDWRMILGLGEFQLVFLQSKKRRNRIERKVKSKYFGVSDSTKQQKTQFLSMSANSPDVRR